MRTLISIGILIIGSLAAPASASEATELRPLRSSVWTLGANSVVDPERGRVYLLTESGLEAVDVSTGTSVWTADPVRPLRLVGRYLLVQISDDKRLRLGRVDVTGEVPKVKTCGRIDVPDEITGNISDGLGRTLQVKVEQRDGALYLFWNGAFVQARSADATPDPPAASKRTSGVARVDVGKCKVKVVEKAPPPTDYSEYGDLKSVEQGGVWMTRPVRMGGREAALQRVDGKVVLKRWRGPDEPLEDVELGADPGAMTVSADRRHLALQIRPPLTNPDEPPPGMQWKVLSLATGGPLFEADMDAWASAFWIWHGIIVYRDVFEVRAFRIKDRKQLWTREVRNTRYRGSKAR